MELQKQEVIQNVESEDFQYRSAKKWQICLYPLAATSNNAFMFLMMLVSYYATGILGLGTVAISTVLTGTRMFDGFIDPFIGLLVDKTNWKYGKIRLFIGIGYTLMTAMILTIFFLIPMVSSGLRIFFFIICYILYIIGYSVVATITTVGFTVMTNNPKQRPLLGGLQTIYNIIFFSIAGYYLSNYLAMKYGGLMDPGLFKEFSITVIIVAGIFALMGCLAIWDKDIPENFEVGEQKRVTLRDMWGVIKGNRQLQVFVVTASIDKLALQTASNTIINVVLFGVILGNYALSGALSAISAIPNILVVFFGIRYAAKFGMKKGFLGSLWIGSSAIVLMIALLIVGDPTQIRLDNIGFMTVAFISLHLIISGIRYISTGLLSPMLSDVIDYEAYRSNNFVPGIIGTIYSLIDNVMSSFSNAVVGFVMALVGFKEVFPDVSTPLTDNLLFAGIFLAYGVLLIGWIISVISMKRYDLTSEKMQQIQKELQQRENFGQLTKE